jgi:ATP phosphoribosyltransferase
MKPQILIGAGKGRLLPVLGRFLGELGQGGTPPGRKLVWDVETDRCVLRVALLRWEDIRRNYNRFDMITYGADQWLEGGHKAMIGLRYYAQGACRLGLLVHRHLAGEHLATVLATRRVATSYPNLARDYLGVPEERIVRLSGNAETAVGLGWADCVFDVIESGETARANDLVEVRSYVKFGAVVATGRPEKIPLLTQLRLIPPLADAVTVAFDGNDGTGKSTVARHLVQCGLWNDRPAVLVAPYSGHTGVAADDLRRGGMIVDWASVVGRNHWRAPRQITAVYDRSLLTCLTDLLDAGCPDETIARVAGAWQPLPALTFLCRAPVELCLERIAGRGGATDDFSREPVLRKYEGLYQKAVVYAREKLGLRVVELDTNRPVDAVLQAVKETLEREGLSPQAASSP